MQTIHIVNGPEAAAALTAVPECEEILILEDQLNIGPLKTEDLLFSQGRNRFWQELKGENHASEIRDLENLMVVSTRMSNNPELQMIFWMGNHPADICTYFWLIHYLKKHSGQLGLIKISGLPFIDDTGKLFYPDSIRDIPEKEVPKALKLMRMLTPSEWETDIDEWQKMVRENAGIRITTGGKQWKSVEEAYYDDQILSVLTEKGQKGKRLINHLLQKSALPVNEAFLLNRLRQMAAAGTIEMDGDQIKTVS